MAKHFERKRVLVNCIHGHSRSASVIIYYIMKKYSLSLKEAYHFVNDRRIVWPKFKIMDRLFKQQEVLNPNKDKTLVNKEFEELITFIKDQKLKIAGREYKTKLKEEHKEEKKDE
mmetsp:Transcript_2153/g.1865  ORF Transcript_2153/g.1865 Transcript_2153/m.1865 type:complete len:115 (+) Transcript_2153:631-975(+)